MELSAIKKLMTTKHEGHESPSRFLRIFKAVTETPHGTTKRQWQDHIYGIFTTYTRAVFGEFPLVLLYDKFNLINCLRLKHWS